ncbi:MULTISPECIES: DUF1801 domain-containing protein [unclassified Diaminobutyricimonas]|uniref:DUF1801 domain-containing protein n=1 Tax=unclassified Diaminobutyricimonas TaxID=2643261 RepID=UPI0012F4D60B|nr:MULTISPECIES: DUF1801 domain-containing protein [unclassified Diaminobutyricimonas]
MADEPKTVPTEVAPAEFIQTIPEDKRREQGERVLALMSDATGDAPTMWGPTMIGYGSQHYKYASGREGDWPKVGFAPRKAAITFYGLLDHEELLPLLEKLGKHTTGKGCVYVKKLEDVDESVLRELVSRAYGLANGFTA